MSSGGVLIGGTVVRLILDDATYQAKLAQAKGKTTTAASGIGGAWTRMSTMARSALMALAGSAVAFGVSAVRAAMEAERAQAALANTLRANAALGDVSVDSWERQAEAIQATTGVTDEAVMSAQALLGQFSLTGKQVQQLIPLVVDLSQKMGIDMQAAAKAVGKATQGSAGILSRYGITVGEAALKSDAFGATVQALSSTVGGFAARFGQTFEGQMARLAAQFDELKEDVGRALIPVLSEVATAGQAVLPVIGKLAPAILYVAKAMLAMKVASVVAGGMTRLGTAMVGTVGMLNRAGWAVRGLGSALGAAIPWLTAAVIAMDLARKAGEALGDAMYGAAARAEDEMTRAIGSLVGQAAKGSIGAQELRAELARLEQEARESGGSLRAKTVVLEKADQAYRSGAISADEYVRALRATGIGADEAAGHLRRVEMGMGKFAVAVRRGQRNITGLVGAKLEEWVRETADDIDMATSVFDELAGKSKLSARQVVRAFQASARATVQFGKNLNSIQESLRGSDGDIRSFVTHLQELGPEGQRLAAVLAKNDRAAQRAFQAFVRSDRASQQWAKELAVVNTSASRLVPSVERATKTTNDLARAINGLRSRTITITTQYRTTGTPPPGGGGQAAPLVALTVQGNVVGGDLEDVVVAALNRAVRRRRAV